MQRVYPPYPCKQCGTLFIRQNPRTTWCDECKTITCLACGERFVAVPNYIQKGRAKYCSKTCRYRHMSGSGSPSYKGYVSLNGGYLFYTDAHPTWPKIAVHRATWLEANPDGKCADCGGIVEVVHHLDGDKLNNELSNLEGLCRRCHNLRHWSEGAFDHRLERRRA